MKYQINATVTFEVEADSRAAAHIEAASRLVDAGLDGFDLVRLNISGPIKPGDHVARDLMPGAIGDFIHGGPASKFQNSGGTVDTSGTPDLTATWDNT